MKKAQVSIEFLFVIGIILFLSTFVLHDIFNKRSQIEDTKDFLLKKDFCLEVSSFISGVYAKGIGTTASLKVTGDQLNYPLIIQPNSRNIFVGNKRAAYCTIPINRVSNSTEMNGVFNWFKFEFDVQHRFLRFENIGDFIFVSLQEEHTGHIGEEDTEEGDQDA